MKVIEIRPREIGFVLWGHCQNLLDDPRIKFYLLLRPCFCVISLLYLELYVLGDDVVIS